MKGLPIKVLTPSVTHKVSFKRERPQPRNPVAAKPTDKISRIARLLALAYRIDGMIRTGELKNWTEAARLIGISRARMTQIANLMSLAPEIQNLLTTPLTMSFVGSLNEHCLRMIASEANWIVQRRTWEIE